MRGPLAVVVAGLLAALLGACEGAEDACARDSDCPAGSRCVRNGEHLVCLADGGGGSGGDGGSGGTGGGTGGSGGVSCPDGDEDGVCDETDLCPAVADPEQADGDGDRRGDACDPCPLDAANDADDDGACGNEDNCPELENPGQENRDDDALGDACDPDADGDGALADDCAPLDPRVYPGAADACDGVDTDCAPARCALGFGADGAAWTVRDLTCAPGTRTCAVALRDGEAGRVVALGLAGAPETLGTIAVDGVLGLGIDPRESSDPVFLAVQTGSVIGSFLDSSLAYELEPEALTLCGSIFLSRYLTAAFAVHASVSNLQFISPAGYDSSPPPSQVCDAANPHCHLISLRGLEAGDVPLGLRSGATVVVRQNSASAPAQAYVAFDDDSRIAIAVVGIDGILDVNSSGLLELGTSPSALLALEPDESHLVVVDSSGTGAVVTTGRDVAAHVSMPFSLTACPTALLARDTELLVASRCDGEPPELITLPIVAGLPDQTAATSIPLAGCTPLRLVESPRLDADGPDAVLVGCEGTATVLVLGRD